MAAPNIGLGSAPNIVLGSAPNIILGSASPRRTGLLTSLGYDHRVQPADIDETPRQFEAPLPYVRRMSASKADAVVAQLALEVAQATDTVVLTADTVVIADGMILGKPVDQADGLSMLARLSGRSHTVSTAVSVRRLCPDSCQAGLRVLRGDVCVQTQVSFRSVSVQEALRYWMSGEPQDKAGGYGIQGAASEFVSKVDGSYSGVIGLPLVETRSLLLALGVAPGHRQAQMVE